MSGRDDREELRRRLYRPGVSPADLADYLRVAGSEEDRPPVPPEPEQAATRAPTARRWVVPVGVLAALGAVILCGALVRGTFAQDLTAPTAFVFTRSAPVPGDGSAVVPVLDTGRAPHASGVAVAEGPGRYRYTVAAGDTAIQVAQRFGLCGADVLVTVPAGLDAESLPPGRTIVLQRAATDPPAHDAYRAC